MKLTDFEVLTFDCYGTLIDWEAGIANALGPWAKSKGLDVDQENIVKHFGMFETVVQGETPDKLYPDILAEVLTRIAGHWKVEATPEECKAFGKSVGDWPAFPDSVEALAYLEKHYRLVILSNIDRESFAKSEDRLGVEFDLICTAQDVGSYKPDPRNFDYLTEQVAAMGFEKDKILHTAESQHHDIIPGKAHGLATAWIHRRAERGGGYGATAVPEAPATPDFVTTSMAGFVEMHKAELG